MAIKTGFFIFKIYFSFLFPSYLISDEIRHLSQSNENFF